MQSDSYPATVNEVLDDSITFNPNALRSLRMFKLKKRWRGALEVRHEKIRTLHLALCDIYGLQPPPRLIFGDGYASCSGRSCFIPTMNVIVLRGRLSVVTYLHEFAHARGMNEKSACRWSINLFRRIWPGPFARCTHEGHILRASKRNGTRSEA